MWIFSVLMFKFYEKLKELSKVLIKVFIFSLKCKCDALRDLVPFLQFQKRKKHPWRSVTFSKVAGFLKLYKSRKASQMHLELSFLANCSILTEDLSHFVKDSISFELFHDSFNSFNSLINSFMMKVPMLGTLLRLTPSRFVIPDALCNSLSHFVIPDALCNKLLSPDNTL